MQLKRSGLNVITTCSPHNFDLVKKLGASEAFDYRDPECGKKIRAHTNDGLKYAFDCISEKPSQAICCDALSSKGGKVTNLLPVETPRKDVESAHTLAYTITGEGFKFGPADYPPNKEDFEFGKMFWDLSTKLFAEGKVKVHNPEVREGGLQGVFGGLKDLKEGKVSGVKLVYKL